MKKLEISMTATNDYAAGFLVPVLRGAEGGVCPQPGRHRRDDVMTASTGSTVGTDAGFGVATVAPLPGLRSLAPPIT